MKSLKGAEWVELNGAIGSYLSNGQDSVGEDQIRNGLVGKELGVAELPPSHNLAVQVGEQNEFPAKSNKVFVAHGKNRGPLEQVKKMLDRFKVPYAVAVDEPHAGRPISLKVANLMQECSAGIFIFTPDELFVRQTASGETEEIFRPSENVVFELGAASVLYGKRIVIFKEESVSFPSDFSDLGHISFKQGQLDNRTGDLLDELVGLDLLEVRVKP